MTITVPKRPVPKKEITGNKEMTVYNQLGPRVYLRTVYTPMQRAASDDYLQPVVESDYQQAEISETVYDGLYAEVPSSASRR